MQSRKLLTAHGTLRAHWVISAANVFSLSPAVGQQLAKLDKPVCQYRRAQPQEPKRAHPRRVDDHGTVSRPRAGVGLAGLDTAIKVAHGAPLHRSLAVLGTHREKVARAARGDVPAAKASPRHAELVRRQQRWRRCGDAILVHESHR